MSIIERSLNHWYGVTDTTPTSRDGQHVLTNITTTLFLVNLDHVVVLHLQELRCVRVVDTTAVKQEPQGPHLYAHSFRVGLLEFAELSGHLHAKVNLIGVLAHDLQLYILRGVAPLALRSPVWRSR